MFEKIIFFKKKKRLNFVFLLGFGPRFSTLTTQLVRKERNLIDKRFSPTKKKKRFSVNLLVVGCASHCLLQKKSTEAKVSRK